MVWIIVKDDQWVNVISKKTLKRFQIVKEMFIKLKEQMKLQTGLLFWQNKIRILMSIKLNIV